MNTKLQYRDIEIEISSYIDEPFGKVFVAECKISTPTAGYLISAEQGLARYGDETTIMTLSCEDLSEQGAIIGLQDMIDQYLK